MMKQETPDSIADRLHDSVTLTDTSAPSKTSRPTFESRNPATPPPSQIGSSTEGKGESSKQEQEHPASSAPAPTPNNKHAAARSSAGQGHNAYHRRSGNHARSLNHPTHDHFTSRGGGVRSYSPHSSRGATPELPSLYGGKRFKGQVKFFNSSKGYGFIIPDDGNPVNPGGPAEGPAEQVEYELVHGPNGIQAAKVTGPDGQKLQGDPQGLAQYHHGHYAKKGAHGSRDNSHRSNYNGPRRSYASIPGVLSYSPPSSASANTVASISYDPATAGAMYYHPAYGYYQYPAGMFMTPMVASEKDGEDSKNEDSKKDQVPAAAATMLPYMYYHSATGVPGSTKGAKEGGTDADATAPAQKHNMYPSHMMTAVAVSGNTTSPAMAPNGMHPGAYYMFYPGKAAINSGAQEGSEKDASEDDVEAPAES